MNEWILVGIVIVGTVFVLGGGSWLWSVVSRKTAPPKV